MPWFSRGMVRSRLDAVQRLIQDIKPFLAAMPKARTAKTGA